MWSKTFWMAAAERIVGTVLVSLATSVAATGSVLGVDWPAALGVAGAVAVASLAASVGKARVPPTGEPTLASRARSAGVIRRPGSVADERMVIGPPFSGRTRDPVV